MIGTNQTSGAQELGPSATNSTPGQIDSAWNFGGSCGTDFTPHGTDNVFDTASCFGAANCTGLTTLASWAIAWNGNSPPDGIPMGGGPVDAWIVSGSSYSLDYRQSVPSYVPGFVGVQYALHLEGSIVLPQTPTPSPTHA